MFSVDFGSMRLEDQRSITTFVSEHWAGCVEGTWDVGQFQFESKLCLCFCIYQVKFRYSVLELSVKDSESIFSYWKLVTEIQLQ